MPSPDLHGGELMPATKKPRTASIRQLIALGFGLAIALVLVVAIALGGSSSGHAMSGGQTMPGKSMGESTHMMPSGQTMEDITMGH